MVKSIDLDDNDLLHNLGDINLSETNNYIENILDKLLCKELLYEPILTMKNNVVK